MKKIAFFFWDLQKGGAELVALNLVNSLAKVGVDVDIITLTDINAYSFHSGSKYVKSVQTTNSKCSMLVKYYRYLISFFRLFIKLSKYDILIAGLEYRPSIILYLFSILMRKRFNIWIHCNLHEFSKDVNLFEQLLFKRSLLRCQQIICCSETSKLSLVKYQSNVEKKTLVINNLIDFSNYSNTPLLNSEFSNQSFTILAVGRLVSAKGFEFLIDSFGYLINKYKVNCQLIICGDGILKDTLRDKIDTLSMSNLVKLVGNIDNISEYFNQADLFVSSSITESYSITTLEALYFGVPVIITKTGALELIQRFQVGSIISYGDIVGLADIIYKHINDKDFYQEQKHKVKSLDLEVVNNQIIEPWLSLLSYSC